MAARARGAESTTGPAKGKIEDVEDLLDTMNDATDSLWLWRRAGDRWIFLEARPPEALRALGVRESTRQRTGGGEYRARIRQTNGQWREQRGFSIAGAELPVPAESPGSAAGSSSASPAVATAGALGDLPPWIKQLILPIMTTVGAGIAARLFERPTVDPLVLELVKQKRDKGEAIDPIELQRLILDAERRGETRGETIGELRAKGERRPILVPDKSSGVVEAVREAIPLLREIRNPGGGRTRSLPAQAESSVTPTTRVTPPRPREMHATPGAPADIIPAWLRRFMPYKSFLLSAADNGTDAPAIVELIVKNADETTWAAMLDAYNADSLEGDLYAAMPELRETDERRQFVTELLEDLARDLEMNANDGGDEKDDAAAPDASAAPAAPAAEVAPKKPAKKKASGV